MDTKKIDDLAAKVDQLLKNNQSQIYVMEEATMEPGATDATTETETSEENQQEVSYVNGQGWKFKNYHSNPNVRNNPHLFSYKTNPDPNDRSQGNQFQNPGYQKPYLQNQNQNGKMFILTQAQNQFQNRQNNPQAAPATASEKGKQKEGEQPPLEDVLDDEQDAEQPTVIEPVALTTQEQPVPTRVYTPKVPYPVPAKKSRKDCEEMKCKKMLEELNAKLCLMDAIQMIPSMCSLVKGLISWKTSADSDIMMKGKQKEGEQPPLEDVLDDEQDAEQPTVIEPVALTTQEQPVPTRVYTPKVPYPVPAKKSRKDCEEMKCKKMLEELNAKLCLMDAIQMIPSMCSLVKGLISWKTSADSDIMMVDRLWI
ncbi:hypothetical protein F2Q70_00003860 [Brassica cretica]|uniref:Uncharacterized protein n=1 Tax=Brassica cretica TaxID=69181 RepID=A0A8S9IS75_BRACR|nr:hypothetical protein F2Q70_00003860 [Brassica cretica]